MRGWPVRAFVDTRSIIFLGRLIDGMARTVNRHTPEVATQFMRAFDAGGVVKPFWFELPAFTQHELTQL
jgi:hypothetical protein